MIRETPSDPAERVRVEAGECREEKRKPEPRHNVPRIYREDPEACAQAVRLALNLRANDRR